MITEENNIFHLKSEKVSYIIGIEDGIPMTYYWGKALCNANIKDFVSTGCMVWSHPIDTKCPELPVYGAGDYRSPMLEIEFENGSRVVDFKYKSHKIYSGKPTLNGLPATYVEDDSEAETLEISIYDELEKVEAVLIYSIFQSGAISRSIKLANHNETKVIINRILSASVDFIDNNFETITLQGAWAREAHIERTPLFHGAKTISSCRGGSSHNKNPFMALVRPHTTEQQGEVYSMNFIYSGNFVATAELSSYDTTRLQMGINPFDFAWILNGGEEFQTPEVIMVYSDEGLNGMSAVYHELYKNRLCRGKFRDTNRPILINNWEATYFNFKEEKLLEIAKVGRGLGLELFVLDDGWFGERDNDDCSLGDWVVDKNKLPNGLDSLVEKVNAMGMEFGLWFEPEMVCPISDLYKQHPDWCIHIKGRERTQIRQQLVLDLSKDEVCQYIINAVSEVLKSANITYVKWDMNRSMTEIPYMDTSHKFMLGLYKVLETLISTFPNILFESCSGGGGRFDGGMLYYMPQIWTSDDTDAYERMFIQYGTSMVYPISVMDNNVAAVPNHQTGRSSTLKMRGDVALFGNYGYMLDLSKITDEEKEIMKEQVEFYKANRELIHNGCFFRIESPLDGNYAIWQVVSKDKSETIVCAFKKMTIPNSLSKRFKLIGLDTNKTYVSQDGSIKTTGDVLMNVGLTFPETIQDFESYVVKFTEL